MTNSYMNKRYALYRQLCRVGQL